MAKKFASDNEKKVLKAAGAAQNSLGCPLIIHPGRDEAAPTEIVRILAEAGADIKRTVMSHLDRKCVSQTLTSKSMLFFLYMYNLVWLYSVMLQLVFKITHTVCVCIYLNINDFSVSLHNM